MEQFMNENCNVGRAVKWYPVSPIMINESGSMKKRSWRNCIIADSEIEYKPYDPYGAVPGLPYMPEGAEYKRKYASDSKCERWTTEMDEVLVRMRNEGTPYSKIAQVVNVTASSALNRGSLLKQRGLITFSGRATKRLTN